MARRSGSSKKGSTSSWYCKKIGDKTIYASDPLSYDEKAREYSVIPRDKWEEKLKDFDLNELRFPDSNVAVAIKNSHNKTSSIPAAPYKLCLVNYEECLVPTSIRDDKYLDNQKITQDLLDDMTLFLDGKDEYAKMETIHKRCYLIYGPQGTGKTSYIRNYINNYIKQEFIAIWMDGELFPSSSMMKLLNEDSRLKIYIFEEITTSTENPSNMQDLLQFLDGENSPSNCLVFATTNYPEVLQKNLADRPGRFDVAKEIKNPSVEEAIVFYKEFLGREMTVEEIAGVSTRKDLSVAHIKEVVLKHRVFKKTLLEAFKEVSDAKAKADRAFKEHSSKMGF